MSPVPANLTKLNSFLSGAIRSRLAWLLVFLHASWFLLTIANMSPPSHDVADFIEHSEWTSTSAILAGRPFHYHYESLSLQILFFVDLPSSLASIPVGFLALPFLKLFHLGLYEGSYVGAGILFALSAWQWLTIGYFADKWLGSEPWGPSLLLRIHRSFIVLTVLILLFNAISAPMVNARSRRLGLRHGGISFHH
jgi:hypothetical protein